MPTESTISNASTQLSSTPEVSSENISHDVTLYATVTTPNFRRVKVFATNDNKMWNKVVASNNVTLPRSLLIEKFVDTFAMKDAKSRNFFIKYFLIFCDSL